MSEDLPPNPPSAPGPSTPGPTPWERRAELGLVQSFNQTWKASVMRPGAFFSAMEPSERVSDAFLYALIIHFFAHLLNFPFRVAIDGPESAVVGMVVGVLASLVVLVVFAAAVHGSGLIFGVAERGFAATFRTVCYASSPLVFSIWLLGVVTGIAWVVLVIIGLSRVHRATGGRAAVAVLSPFAVLTCCCGLGLGGAIVGIFAALDASDISWQGGSFDDLWPFEKSSSR